MAVMYDLGDEKSTLCDAWKWRCKGQPDGAGSFQLRPGMKGRPLFAVSCNEEMRKRCIEWKVTRNAVTGLPLWSARELLLSERMLGLGEATG